MSGEDCSFVSYVYPGSHACEYRKGFDEWALLDRFKPYFPGHAPPPAPIQGRYDDSDPATIVQQIRNAREHGLAAFSYFAYYGRGGFIMQRPADAALGIAADGFTVALTLCLRLPHQTLPLPRDFRHWRAAGGSVIRPRSPVGEGATIERSIEPRSAGDEFTIADLEGLLGSERARQIPLSAFRRLVEMRTTAAPGNGRVANLASTSRLSGDLDSGAHDSTAPKSLQRLEPLTLKESARLFESWAERCVTPNAYWCIEGRPVCAFLNIGDYALVYGLKGFSLMLETGRAVFRSALGVEPFIIGVVGQTSRKSCDLATRLPIDAVTGYGLLPHWSGPPVQDYDGLIADRVAEWQMMQSTLPVPFLPVVCAGWDATVRGEWIEDLNNSRGFPWRPVVTGVSTESFGAFIDEALAFNRRHHRDLNVVFVHAWNEWTEASAVEPSDRFGYGFLREIRARAGQSTSRLVHNNHS